MANIYFAQPCYGSIEFEAASAVDNALRPDSEHRFALTRMSKSLLANCFNTLWADCLNAGEFDWFAMLHSDVAPNGIGWLDTLIDEANKLHVDVMHAVCALKDSSGNSSTALGYGDDWGPFRRLTMTELSRLPESFVAGDCRRVVDPSAEYLLPNTGCVLIRLCHGWIHKFPGFRISDRIVRDEHGKLAAAVVSEDWNFGIFCADEGVPVGGTTAVKTRHIGRIPFMTEAVWGSETDDVYLKLRERLTAETK